MKAAMAMIPTLSWLGFFSKSITMDIGAAVIGSLIFTKISGLSDKDTEFQEKAKDFTEQLESYKKLYEKKEMSNSKLIINEVLNSRQNASQISDNVVDLLQRMISYLVGIVSEVSIIDCDQEYSDFLYNLVMEEGCGFDEDLLVKVLDLLIEDHVVARGFISKNSNMRKKWLTEFVKTHCEVESRNLQ